MDGSGKLEKKGPTLQTDNQHTNHKSPADKSEIIQLTNRTGAHCQHTVMDSLHGGRGKIGCVVRTVHGTEGISCHSVHVMSVGIL